MDIGILIQKWNEFHQYLVDEYNYLCKTPGCDAVPNYIQLSENFPNFMAWLERDINKDK